MNTLETTNYEAVLEVVSHWPTEQRLTLVHDVLQGITQTADAQPKRQTLKKALGLLTTDRPAPSDEQIQQWLDRHRMERYG